METVGRITCTAFWLLLSMALILTGVALIREDSAWLGGIGCAAIMFAGDALEAAWRLWKRSLT